MVRGLDLGLRRYPDRPDGSRRRDHRKLLRRPQLGAHGADLGRRVPLERRLVRGDDLQARSFGRDGGGLVRVAWDHALRHRLGRPVPLEQRLGHEPDLQARSGGRHGAGLVCGAGGLRLRLGLRRPVPVEPQLPQHDLPDRHRLPPARRDRHQARLLPELLEP